MTIQSAGLGFSTDLPGIDFETYSEAGYVLIDGVWKPIVDKKPGLFLVGASAYARHPSTEIVSLAYDIKDGRGVEVWRPGRPSPDRLFKYLASGGKIAAWNSFFEHEIWNQVGVNKLGWAPLRVEQQIDTMAKAASWSLPLSLGNAGAALSHRYNLPQKDTRGDFLIRKLSIPQKPTKKVPLTRFNPVTHTELFREFYKYNAMDVTAENAIGNLCPDLSPIEQQVWQTSERINIRGVGINLQGVKDCIRLLKATEIKYLSEMERITEGAVDSVSKTAKLREWMSTRGVDAPSVDKDQVALLLDSETLPTEVRRVLEIRQLLGQSSVKKLYALEAMATSENRVHGLFKYGGAPRTGRFSGSDVQPHNLPKQGPFKPWKPWEFLQDVGHMSLEQIEAKYTNPIMAISGALRTLFVPAPGTRFICSDYSAIEAVVLGEIAEEPWRQEVFRTHGKIYEASGSKISGIPLEVMAKYKLDTGDHHPSRGLGKLAELASGYGGAQRAWVRFGADKFLNEEERADAIKAWRKASPNVTKLWYGLERTAIKAVRTPGVWQHYKRISYKMNHVDGVLYCKLPSGRFLSYHQACIQAVPKPWGDSGPELRYHGWNADPLKGPRGWVQLSTWGGKLTENVIQAISRDILVEAMLACERGGYPIVIHVHDEIVAEVPHGRGSVAELEHFMCRLPSWAEGWPIRAAGGWEGYFYRKD